MRVNIQQVMPIVKSEEYNRQDNSTKAWHHFVLYTLYICVNFFISLAIIKFNDADVSTVKFFNNNTSNVVLIDLTLASITWKSIWMVINDKMDIHFILTIHLTSWNIILCLILLLFVY